MRSAPALAFDYRPSRPVLAAAGVMAVLALLAPWWSGLPRWAAALLTVPLALAATCTLVRYARPRWRRISHGAAGWSVRDRSGADMPAELIAWSHGGPLLTLSLKPADGRVFHALLAFGNPDAQTRRALILLLARAGAGEPAQAI